MIPFTRCPAPVARKMKQIFSPRLSTKWKVVNNLSIVFTAIKLLIPPPRGNLTLAISTALTAITPFQESFFWERTPQGRLRSPREVSNLDSLILLFTLTHITELVLNTLRCHLAAKAPSLMASATFRPTARGGVSPRLAFSLPVH